jgi:hypothetical protein
MLLVAILKAILAFLRRLLGRGRDRSPNETPDGDDGSGVARVIQLREPGQLAPDVIVETKTLAPQFRRSFAQSAAGTATTDDVIWVDGGNELLVRLSKIRVVTRDGFVLVGITVYTEQTGDTEIVVPFAVGSPESPLGLIAATEPRPRGDTAILDIWSDQLIAAAWEALMRVAADTAAAAGVDDTNEALLATGLVASDTGLIVTPQARHRLDRRAE